MNHTPVITRPNRTIRIDHNPPTSPKGENALSPVTIFQNAFSRNTQSPQSGNSGHIPRPPVVHFFICDYGNTKVKAFSEIFKNLLLKNGINVYIEQYLTNQPGYQVCAASLDTQADFFFQIHSKTAGPGHVRLYLNGTPHRMPMNEAIAAVWSRWRARCGILTREEVDTLSSEKILEILLHYGVDLKTMNISAIQSQLHTAISSDPSSIETCYHRLQGCQDILQDALIKINSTPGNTLNDWPRAPGVIVTDTMAGPVENVLSRPLRDLLVSIIRNAITKIDVLMNIANKHIITRVETDRSIEIPIPSIEDEPNRGGDGSYWRMMLESTDDDNRIKSMHIASYGDMKPIESLNIQPSFLDQF